MTAAQGTVERLFEVTRPWLNTEEEPAGSNLQPFAAIAGHVNGRAWCCTFCVATAKQAGIKGVPDTASCQSSVDAYKAAHRLVGVPKRGDQGFLFFPKLNRYAHTGWVEEVRDGLIVLQIEGNTDARGGRTGGKVMRQLRSYEHGMVFGRPLYVVTTLRRNLGLKTPLMTGSDVVEVHGYLISLDPKNKARLGADVAAKRYGRATSNLVTAFKKSRRITEAGWGSKCWAWMDKR